MRAVVSKTATEPAQVGDAEGDMGFPCRAELGVDPEVEVDRAAAVPDPATAGEMDGFRDFNKAEQPAEKPARLFF